MTQTSAPGFQLQESPQILVAALPGNWLLEHTTPSWRIEDPELGFQRMVRKERAQLIANSVLDRQRPFPNALVLATDTPTFKTSNGSVTVPSTTRFLVVDGQHRLWAQKYSDYEATYACVVHCDRSEEQMAELFLEINDNQKRVPSSLRWDLVRLVRPEDDPEGILAAELTRELAFDEASPLFQRIDLTGEQNAVALKQGSVAPEIKRLVSKRSALHGASFDHTYDLLIQYLVALRSLEPDTWGTADSRFYKARVLRGLLRVLEVIVRTEETLDLDHRRLRTYLERIDLDSLGDEAIRSAQGNAGIAAITKVLTDQVFD